MNRANVLRLFTEGDIYDVTNADVSDWRLDYDVVQYRFWRQYVQRYFIKAGPTDTSYIRERPTDTLYWRGS